MPVDAVDIDYEQIRQEAYYLSQGVCDRFNELIEISYDSKMQAAKAFGISNALLSRYNYVKRLHKLLNYAHIADMSLFYLLDNIPRYKYESWVKMNTSCWNLITCYKDNVYKYKMPKSLCVVIHNLCSGKNSNLGISTLYSFSLIYKKPIWWLLQDYREVMVNPETRLLKGDGKQCSLL